jgi:predicted acetyltransferase
LSIEVLPAAPEQAPILANLLELFSHDLSEFIDLKLQPDGRYGYPLLSRYWTEEGRLPFLVLENRDLAGFALVSRGSRINGRRDVWDMAEFFIVRGSRRRGVGAAVAHEILRRHTGAWEIRVRENNPDAAAFWESTVRAFTTRRDESVFVEGHGARWKVHSFQSSEGEALGEA